MRSIVEVLTPASSFDLVTLEVAKDELNIDPSDTSQDTRLQRWITSESRHIARYCNRVLVQETVRETFVGIGGALWWTSEALVLNRRPVQSISSVVIDSTTLGTEEWDVDAEKGLLYRVASGCRIGWAATSVVVTYAGGYPPDAIDEDLQEVCFELLKLRQAARTRDPALRQITVEGMGTKTFWVAGTQEGDMPPGIGSALTKFREVSIA